FGDFQTVYERVHVGAGGHHRCFLLDIRVAFAQQVEGKRTHWFVNAARRGDASLKLQGAALGCHARRTKNRAKKQTSKNTRGNFHSAHRSRWRAAQGTERSLR